MISCKLPKKSRATKKPPTKIPTAKVTFTVARPDLGGHKLAVVGDFNDWNPQATPMEEVGEGTWTTVLELPPGRYRFRYRTEDGHWFNDEGAHAYEDNGHGSEDGVLDLPAPEAPVQVPAG